MPTRKMTSLAMISVRSRTSPVPGSVQRLVWSRPVNIHAAAFVQVVAALDRQLAPGSDVDDGMAPATINRATAGLRGYGAWLSAHRIVAENPAAGLKNLPLNPPALRSLPPVAIDALLRAVRAEADARLR